MSSFSEHLLSNQLDAMRDLVSDEIDPASLTVEELREEIAAREEIERDIIELIQENDLNRRRMDPELRVSLREERSTAIKEAAELRAVLASKVAPAVRRPPKAPPPGHLELMRQQEEAAARRRREKAARHAALMAIDEEKYRDARQLFVKAAYQIYGKERCLEIWAKARELWPDARAWVEIGPEDEV